MGSNQSFSGNSRHHLIRFGNRGNKQNSMFDYFRKGLSDREKRIRINRFRLATRWCRWEQVVSDPGIEGHAISRRPVAKITVAANVFYASLGLILAFMLQIPMKTVNAEKLPSMAAVDETV